MYLSAWARTSIPALRHQCSYYLGLQNQTGIYTIPILRPLYLDWDLYHQIPWFSGLHTQTELRHQLIWFFSLWKTDCETPIAFIIAWANFYLKSLLLCLLVLFSGGPWLIQMVCNSLHESYQYLCVTTHWYLWLIKFCIPWCRTKSYYCLLQCYFSRDQFLLICFDPLLGVCYYFVHLLRTQVELLVYLYGADAYSGE